MSLTDVEWEFIDRMQAAAGLKHLIEYFIFMEEDVTSEGNKDVLTGPLAGPADVTVDANGCITVDPGQIDPDALDKLKKVWNAQINNNGAPVPSGQPFSQSIGAPPGSIQMPNGQPMPQGQPGQVLTGNLPKATKYTEECNLIDLNDLDSGQIWPVAVGDTVIERNCPGSTFTVVRFHGHSVVVEDCVHHKQQVFLDMDLMPQSVANSFPQSAPGWPLLPFIKAERNKKLFTQGKQFLIAPPINATAYYNVNSRGNTLEFDIVVGDIVWHKSCDNYFYEVTSMGLAGPIEIRASPGNSSIAGHIPQSNGWHHSRFSFYPQPLTAAQVDQHFNGVYGHKIGSAPTVPPVSSTVPTTATTFTGTFTGTRTITTPAAFWTLPPGYTATSAPVAPAPKDPNFPHECPRCRCPAYIGFNSVDCSRGCK